MDGQREPTNDREFGRWSCSWEGSVSWLCGARASAALRCEGGRPIADQHVALQRSALPIPDVTPAMTIANGVSSPGTSFPLIVLLRPPTGAPNVLDVLVDPYHRVHSAMMRP